MYKILKACLPLSAIIIAGACSKVEKGFLSPNLYYVENPLYTTQGSVTVSSSLTVDGSTTPMSVELLKVTDENGNDVTDVVTKEDSIQGFTGSVSYTDSTLDLLNKKIATTAAVPLSVAPTGGRIQLTPATKYIPTGTYKVSVKATNVRGTRELNDACTVIISGSGAAFVDYGGTYAGTFDGSTGTFLYNVGISGPDISYAKTDINKIVYKFYDKDGKLYNAKQGGITSRKLRWSMREFDPYYPQVLTDSSVEYQFPNVPNQFPAFLNPGIGGIIPRGTYGVFPAVPGPQNSTGSPVFVFLDNAFFEKGTFVIAVHFTDISWK